MASSGFLGGFLGGVGGGAIGSAVVRLVLDSSQYSGGLAKAKGETASATNVMGASFSKFKLAASAALGIAGFAAIKFVKDSVAAFEESQAVLAQTEAVIKSTGHAAGLTADQIHELAVGFQQTTTYSDEAVQGAENLLLTFTKISGDTLPAATQAVLDTSTALGKDLTGTAIQVGKALQNPTIGLTALRRSGVTFTLEQVEVIKALDATGHSAEAQALIIKELNREFGGSAAAATKTFAGQMAQLGNDFNDVQEKIGGLIAQLLEALLPAIKAGVAGFGKLVEVIVPLVPLLVKLGTGFVAFKAAVLGTQLVTAALEFGLLGLADALYGAAVSLQVFLNGAGAMLGPIYALAKGIQVAGQEIDAWKRKDPVGFFNAMASGMRAFNIQVASIPTGDLETFQQKTAEVTAALQSGQISAGVAAQRIVALGQEYNVTTGSVQDILPALTTANFNFEVMRQKAAIAADGVANLGGEFQAAQHKVVEFAGMSGKVLADFRSSVVDNIRSTFGTISSFDGKWRLAGATVQRQTQRMADSIAQFNDDLDKLNKLKIGDNIKQFLLDQGPGAVDAFVNANKGMRDKITSNIRDINNGFKESKTKVNDLTDGVGGLKTSLQGLDGTSINVNINTTVSGVTGNGADAIAQAVADAIRRKQQAVNS